MSITPAFPGPMGADDLADASSDARVYADALEALSAAVSQFKSVTGRNIAVIEAFTAVAERQESRTQVGSDDLSDDAVEDDAAPASGQETRVGIASTPEVDAAIEHLRGIGPSGVKWGFSQDLEMIERAIEGQSEATIAAVMEFSRSHIRQRFSLLVTRPADRSRHKREDVAAALRILIEE